MKLIDLKNDELLIDKNTDEPIIIIYDLDSEDKTSVKVKIKKDIKASLVEVFLSKNANKNFKREFVIEENAELEYLKYQNISANSSLDLEYDFNLYENSRLSVTNLELGLGKTNSKFHTNLENENSKLQINGLVKLYEQANAISSFTTKHIAQNCFSDIKYKHSLDDKTKAVFEAKSIVEEKASYSKVLQNSDTLLLSEDAVIFARPHLEINIDELEASHGATTGSLDEEQLLYLQARGIPEIKAKEMLLKAFENEIYDSIEDSKIRDFITGFKRKDHV